MIKIIVGMFFLLQIVVAGPAEDGRKIAEKADKNIRGFGDEYTKNTMYLINANKDTVVRKMVSLTLEREFAEDHSIIQFLDPPDVKGTGLLTYQNPAGDDKQWLYLPDLRRVKKISSRKKSGSFMGSEFAYEDITGNTLNKFKYKKLEDATYNGIDCYVVEKVPTYKNSGYTKIKVWFSKENYLAQRMEYTDRKNSLLKVQTFLGWKLYGKSSWRADGIVIENLQTKKKSVLNFADRKLGTGKYKASDFTTRALERIIH